MYTVCSHTICIHVCSWRMDRIFLQVMGCQTAHSCSRVVTESVSGQVCLLLVVGLFLLVDSRWCCFCSWTGCSAAGGAVSVEEQPSPQMGGFDPAAGHATYSCSWRCCSCSSACCSVGSGATVFLYLVSCFCNKECCSCSCPLSRPRLLAVLESMVCSYSFLKITFTDLTILVLKLDIWHKF